MTGFDFYWFFWFFWVLSTFFMKKGSNRAKISIWLLIIIILSSFSFQIVQITVSWAAIFMIFTAYMLIIKENRRTAAYTFINSYILMLGFAGFQLMELYDPVWLMFERKWMLTSFIVCLTILLQKNFHLQTQALITGIIHGDFLYGVLVREIMDYQVGSLLTLNVIAISLACILLIHLLREAAVFFDQNFKQQEGEKQKTS